MLPQHLALAQPLGSGRQHILLADFFQKRVFGQHRGDGKAAQHHGRNRQRDMPEVVGDARAPAQRLPIGRGQPAQRKPLQLPAKHHQQRHTQHKAGNRIADQHHQRGNEVKPAARPHCLGHAQRHGNQVAEKKRPQPQADRDRKFFLDQLPHILVLVKAVAQIKARKASQHLQEALMHRLVKAIKRLDFLDALCIHTLAAPVARAGAGGALTARIAPLQLGHHLLDRPARHKLHHGKGQQQHAEQGRNHQQQTLEDIAGHVLVCRYLLDADGHQVVMAQVSGW